MRHGRPPPFLLMGRDQMGITSHEGEKIAKNKKPYLVYRFKIKMSGSWCWASGFDSWPLIWVRVAVVVRRLVLWRPLNGIRKLSSV